MPSPDVRSVDLPIGTFGGRVTQFDAQQLPLGASPYNQDVIFSGLGPGNGPVVGGVATRPGMQKVYANAFAGNPTVNYLRTFIDSQENVRQEILDGLGVLREEFPLGTLTQIAQVVAGCFSQSDTLFGREWMAFGDGKFGIDLPRQWDGTNFDRVSQCGPGAPPTVGDDPTYAAIAASGVPGLSVAAVTDNIAAISEAGNVVTVTLATYTGYYQVGQQIVIASVATTTTFNGTWVLTAVNPAALQLQFYISVTGLVADNTGTVSTYQVTATLVTAAQAGLFPVGSLVTVALAGVGYYDQTYTVISSNAGTGVLVLAAAVPAITGTSDNISTIIQNQSTSVVTVTLATFNGTYPVGGPVVIAGLVQHNSPGNASLSNGAWTILASNATLKQIQFYNPAPLSGDNGGNGGGAGTATTYVMGSPANSGAGQMFISGAVSTGLHGLSVCFVTRQGYITKPAPPVYWNAAGGKRVFVQNIPTGPANIIQRILIFTPAIIAPATTGPYFYFDGAIPVPNGPPYPSMVIADNVTTSGLFNFQDAVLQLGSAATYLFNMLELGECSSCVSYSSRMFWAGERNKVPNILNFTFDGGWALGAGTGGSDVPLGWMSNLALTGGGARSTAGVWDDAYQITGDGVHYARGWITQQLFQDFLGVPILQPNTSYSIRVRVASGGGLAAGNLDFRCVDNTSSAVGDLVITPAQVNAKFQEFTGVIWPASAQVGPLATLWLLGANHLLPGAVMTNGGYYLIDCIEIFPTLTPYNIGQVRGSYAFMPEAFDAVTGFLQVDPTDGQAVRSMFRLLDNKLYLVKERGMSVTNDDGQNEPSGWTVNSVSDGSGKPTGVGTPSVNGTAVAEGSWAIIASHDGAYIFDGGVPVKISQEIQPDWNTINWAAGSTIWVAIDTFWKRIHIGVPTGSSLVPNIEFVMDYSQLGGSADIMQYAQAYYSVYMPGKVIAPGRARKWTVWNLSSNSGALTLRADGSYHMLRGNATGTGKVYDQVIGQLSDDGVAIPWAYQTFFFPDADQEMQLQLGAHGKLFQYLTGYAWGAGGMEWTVYGAQNQRAVSLTTLTLQNPAQWDFEMNVNFEGERMSLLFEADGQVGSWGQVSKLCPVLKKSIARYVRGVA